MRKPNILAHWDAFTSGAIPCRVLVVRETPDGLRFDVQLTAARGPYARGEIMRDCTPRAVIPRGFLRRRKYGTTVWAYDWRAVLAKYGVQPVSDSDKDSAR